MRILINMSYNGKDFHGFQHQPGERTVQGEIEAILSEMHKTFTRIHPASRTDRGVHALDQYIHFDTELNIEPSKWAYILNSRLPDDIYIKSSVAVSEDFHVRYANSKKTYRYKMYTSVPDPFKNGLAVHIHKNLDINKMNNAARQFIGTHDFTTFSSAKAVIENKERHIYRCDLETNDDTIELVITGSGFLYNMVRIIVAYLIEVGSGARKDETKELLEATDRTRIPRTAPAAGLYLEEIDYGW